MPIIFPQAVASSAPMENIDAVLDETGIRSYFQAIISAFGMPGKPDPWVFLEAGKQLGVKVGTAIVLEEFAGRGAWCSSRRLPLHCRICIVDTRRIKNGRPCGRPS